MKKNVDASLAFKTTFLKLLQRYPYADITVKLICDTAGYSKQYFYQLFDGKESLRQTIIEDELSNIDQLIRQKINNLNGLRSYDDVVEVHRAFFKHIKELKELYALLNDHPCFEEFKSRLTRYILVHDQLPIFIFKDKTMKELEYYNFLSTCCLVATVDFYIRSNCRLSEKEIVDLFIKIFGESEFVTLNDLYIDYDTLVKQRR